jgi:cytochrome c2
MLRKMGTVLIIVIFLLAAIGIAMSEENGNPRKGKYLFRKNCRTCHV